MPQFKDKDEFLDKLFDHMFGDIKDDELTDEDHDFFDHVTKFFVEDDPNSNNSGQGSRRRRTNTNTNPPRRRRQSNSGSGSNAGGYGSSSWFGTS